MALYKKSTQVFGMWIPKKDLKDGMIAVIINETMPQPSNFTDKNGDPQFQDVCKIKVNELAGEFNANLNKPTTESLIDAFGEDSLLWMNHPLTIAVEKTRVAGKAGISLFLIPEGYHKIDNKEGFAEIIKNTLAEEIKV
jgi:hypothetical protein